MVNEERTCRLLFAVDEINRAPTPKQNEFFDLADGKYTFDGKRLYLGRDGYTVFMATANLNRLNNDFSGTFELDRALLNRAHLTIDLDHHSFRPTPEDEMIIEVRKANPKVDFAEPQDLSEKILAANKEVVASVKKLDPYFTAFRFLIGRGLDYCDADIQKEKGANFPMLCNECSYSGKDLCSRIRSSSERTIITMKALAYAMNYIAKLKSGKEVEIDPFDAALQAFRFTTYHGNLNEIIVTEEYAARKQAMMDETVEKLSEAVDIVRSYLPMMIKGYNPVIVVYQFNGREMRTVRDDKIISRLNKKGISYHEADLETELKQKGVGADWVYHYVRKMRELKWH
jgi:hypothetical protein